MVDFIICSKDRRIFENNSMKNQNVLVYRYNIIDFQYTSMFFLLSQNFEILNTQNVDSIARLQKVIRCH